MYNAGNMREQYSEPGEAMSESHKTKFYEEMFELQFSYLHHRLRREPWWGMDYGFGNFTMLKAIGKYGPGVRMDLDEIPWREILAQSWNDLNRYNLADEQEEFIGAMWKIFGERWLAAYPPFEKNNIAQNWFGCFRYHYDDATKQADFHFYNADEPDSPFEDMEKRRDDLLRIIKDIDSKKIKPESVRFDSWMNNLKPIVDLFPESLKKSLKPTEEFPKGYGWWGQFITKDGGIHPRRAELMKQEGRFEYKRLMGSCPWEDFRRKVEGK